MRKGAKISTENVMMIIIVVLIILIVVYWLMNQRKSRWRILEMMEKQ